MAGRLLGCFGYSLSATSSSTFMRREDGLGSFTFPALFSLFMGGASSGGLCGNFHLLTTSNSSFGVRDGPRRASSRCPNGGNVNPCGVLRLSTICSLLTRACRSIAVINSERTGRREGLYRLMSHSGVSGTVIVTSENCRGCGLVTRVGRGN